MRPFNSGLSVVLFGSQRVAMKQGGVVTYLLGDHLGSTSVASTASGALASRQTREAYAFGAMRTSDVAPITSITDYNFTGQKLDSDGLMYYNARYYDASLNRFIQPDSIVPNLYNPQSLNRYSYAVNNPVNLVDPTGHAPQYPGDDENNPDPCSTDWCWQNRWYRAHGYNWNDKKGDWVMPGTPNPKFYDEAITDAVIAEGGVTLRHAIWTTWTWDQKKVVARGLSIFGAKLIDEGGLGYLARLLGNAVNIYLDPFPPLPGDICSYACAPPPPVLSSGNNIFLSGGVLTSPTGYMDVVHELAHIIDWHSSIGGRRFSDAWQGAPLTQYAVDGAFQPAERFAEAVSVYVFGTAYRNKILPGVTDLTVQMSRMDALLSGWY